MNRFASFVTTIVCVFSTMLAYPASASAGERAMSSRGRAQFVSPNDFIGSGQATHLGAYSEVGSAAFAPTPIPGVLALTGWSRYTAANGDQLHATLEGELNTLTGQAQVTIRYVGGTGRFVNASGTALLRGQMLPGGEISIAVEGSIEY